MHISVIKQERRRRFPRPTTNQMAQNAFLTILLRRKSLVADIRLISAVPLAQLLALASQTS